MYHKLTCHEQMKNILYLPLQTTYKTPVGSTKMLHLTQILSSRDHILKKFPKELNHFRWSPTNRDKRKNHISSTRRVTNGVLKLH